MRGGKVDPQGRGVREGEIGGVGVKREGGEGRGGGSEGGEAGEGEKEHRSVSFSLFPSRSPCHR